MDQFGDELRFGGRHGADHLGDFIVAEERALTADQRAGAGPQEEHVAVAQQSVGTHLVEHHAAIGAAGDLEGDSGRQVRFDQAGNHVDGRFLRGQHQVDTHCAALLCQPNDVALHLLRGGHHQVGQLVGHNDDVGHVGGEV